MIFSKTNYCNFQFDEISKLYKNIVQLYITASPGRSSFNLTKFFSDQFKIVAKKVLRFQTILTSFFYFGTEEEFVKIDQRSALLYTIVNNFHGFFQQNNSPLVFNNEKLVQFPSNQPLVISSKLAASFRMASYYRQRYDVTSRRCIMQSRIRLRGRQCWTRPSRMKLLMLDMTAPQQEGLEPFPWPRHKVGVWLFSNKTFR